jgi:hypothetical protein
VTTKLNTEVSSAERASSRYVGSVVGHAPLAARGAGRKGGQRRRFFSETQHHQLHLQVMAVYNYLLLAG